MSSTPLSGRLPVPLRDGTTSVEGWRNVLFAQSVGAEPSYTEINPTFLFVAATSGIGSSLDEILAQADADVSDGPMLGSCTLEFFEPLQTDKHYQVTGEIVDIARRVGSTLGTFDLLTYELRLSVDQTVAAGCQITLVVPRRDQNAT